MNYDEIVKLLKDDTEKIRETHPRVAMGVIRAIGIIKEEKARELLKMYEELLKMYEELLKMYEEIPNGAFGAIMIKQSIDKVESAMANGNTVEMLRCLKDLKESK